jgi:8-oxo-dGTP pyrophosphatase MutT (NUDIX family)
MSAKDTMSKKEISENFSRHVLIPKNISCPPIYSYNRSFHHTTIPHHNYYHKANEANKNNRNIACCNCGKQGHIYKKCFQPITSIGIICFKLSGNTNINLNKKNKIKINKELKYDPAVLNKYKPELLFIRRKDSLAFAEIARAKYKTTNKEYIKKMIQNMTKNEIEFLRNVEHADDIWKRLWMTKKVSKTRQEEYNRVYKKLQTLIDGTIINNQENISFKSIINEIDIVSAQDEPEWGFPKGRRNPKETNIECALREFKEETDIDPSKIKILSIQPVEEIFTGSNDIKYKHVYYIGVYNGDEKDIKLNPKNKNQKAEVSAIKWCSPDEIIEKIRDNSPERKKLVSYTTNFIVNSSLYVDKTGDD